MAAPSSADRPVQLLSIDGGGVRGLSALVMLQQIMDRANALRAEQGLDAQEPWEVFDMMGGTSTGGLIAIMLGRLRMSMKDTIKAYMELSGKAFSKRNIVERSLAKATLGAKFKTEPLEDALKDVIGADWKQKLLKDEPSSTCRVFVVSHQTSVTNTTAILRSYRHPTQVNSRLDTVKIWEAARATSAAMTFFDPIEIDGIEYSDGGLLYNNPVALVHGEASAVFANREQIIVSLGTGRESTTPFKSSLPSIAQQLAKIATNTQRQANEFHLRDNGKAAREKRYFRFNVPEIGDMAMDESTPKDLKYLKEMTEEYLNEPEIGDKTGHCCERLVEGALNMVSETVSFPKAPVAGQAERQGLSLEERMAALRQ